MNNCESVIMRYIFMGTPAFAKVILNAMIEAGRIPVGVLSQPDQPAGRGKNLTPSPVKILAEQYDIPIRQPRKIGQPTRDWMKELKPDICVVAAYGKILCRETLDVARYGCINAHASLLPKYRGAAPVTWAIVNGEKETGVSIMRIDQGMDTGDVLLQKKVPIEIGKTCGDVGLSLARIAGPMLMEVMDQIAKGRQSPVKQEDMAGKPSFAPPLSKKDGRINWDMPAENLVYRISGMNPWPGAYTWFGEKLLKIHSAEKVELCHQAKPGTVIGVEKAGIVVAAKTDAIRLLDVQLQGKKVMPSFQFANGCRLQKEARFLSVRE